MKNFVYISPNFPTNHWHFCQHLQENGIRVLGVGDQAYNDLSSELRDSLHEYYKVGSLENYDEVYRAVAYFIHKYGRIDYLESNNEYWLESDAHLRSDFNIDTGFKIEDIPDIKYKSRMKKFYQQANIPVAPYTLVNSRKDAEDFIKKYHYPVIVKPDNGVGATRTYKLTNEAELNEFFQHMDAHTSYIMEIFVKGEVNSYDAIIDSKGNIVFEAGNISPMSIMDIVNQADNSVFYIDKRLAEDVKAAGRSMVKAYNVRNRFVHFEFFRLLENQDGLGPKGIVIGLEVNMRPSGGVSPDMLNFARSTDVYKIWADTIAFDATQKAIGESYYAIFVGRRNGKDFVLDHEAIMKEYQHDIQMHGHVAAALSGAMGNYLYIARFKTKAQLNKFVKDLTAVK